MSSKKKSELDTLIDAVLVEISGRDLSEVPTRDLVDMVSKIVALKDKLGSEKDDWSVLSNVIKPNALQVKPAGSN